MNRTYMKQERKALKKTALSNSERNLIKFNYRISKSIIGERMKARGKDKIKELEEEEEKEVQEKEEEEGKEDKS